MKLDRNSSTDGTGKYAVVDLREIRRIGGVKHGHNPDIAAALHILETNGLIEYGGVGTENEFFVIKLKDCYAQNALNGYATTAHLDGEEEYAAEVREMAFRAGPHSPFCKKPD